MSKLWDIVKTVGSTVLSEAVPFGGVIVSAINAVAPDHLKLPENATGKQAQAVINQLTPEQQKGLVDMQFKFDITELKETNHTLRTMIESDAKNPHSTRPFIAKWSFITIAFCCVVLVITWAYGVWADKQDIVKAVNDSYMFVLSVTAPLATLLYAYFGILKQEHKNRLDAVNGFEGGGIVSKFLNRK